MNNYLVKRFVKDPNMVFRQIVDEVILVPIVNSTGDMDSIYTLNEISAYIWELIDGKNTVAEIRDRILEGFEVDFEKAEADLLELVEQLLEIRAIKEV